MVNRYKIQQDKGKYCLKGCDDGDLMDYASHEALFAPALALLRRYQAVTIQPDDQAHDALWDETARFLAPKMTNRYEHICTRCGKTCRLVAGKTPKSDEVSACCRCPADSFTVSPQSDARAEQGK